MKNLTMVIAVSVLSTACANIEQQKYNEMDDQYRKDTLASDNTQKHQEQKQEHSRENVKDVQSIICNDYSEMEGCVVRQHTHVVNSAEMPQEWLAQWPDE